MPEAASTFELGRQRDPIFLMNCVECLSDGWWWFRDLDRAVAGVGLWRSPDLEVCGSGSIWQEIELLQRRQLLFPPLLLGSMDPVGHRCTHTPWR